MIVLDTTRAVVDAAAHVTIDDAAIARWAAAVGRADLEPAGHDFIAALSATRAQLANFVLLTDALNFCFWSADPPHITWRGQSYSGFTAVYLSLLRAAESDPRWFDAAFWSDGTSAELRAGLATAGELLMLDEREAIIRETGRRLLERFDGQFVHAVESVRFRAHDLAMLLLCSFESFRDVAEYAHRPVYFAKRAQICALDLSTAWQLHAFDPLDDLDRLTAMADYRLPQALRHMEIITLDAPLAATIDCGHEIAAGSPPEVELRAATVQAVERMKTALAADGIDCPAWRLDWYLWRRSHDQNVRLPHHRTRTIFY